MPPATKAPVVGSSTSFTGVDACPLTLTEATPEGAPDVELPVIVAATVVDTPTVDGFGVALIVPLVVESATTGMAVPVTQVVPLLHTVGVIEVTPAGIVGRLTWSEVDDS